MKPPDETKTKSQTREGIIQSGKPATLSAGRAYPVVYPKSVPRALTPDLTGLYEAICDDPLKNSAVLVQFNQCGHALVGWMDGPPEWIKQLDTAFGFDEETCRKALLFAERAPGKTSAFGYYQTRMGGTSHDPDVDLLNIASPWPKGNQPTNGDPPVFNVMISWSDDPNAVTSYPSQIVTLAFQNTTGGNFATFRLRRISKAPRLSSRAIAAQEPAFRDQHSFTRASYIPSSYFNPNNTSGHNSFMSVLWRFGPGSALHAAMQRFYDAFYPGGFSSKDETEMRLAVGQIDRELVFPWSGSPHAKYLDAQVAKEIQNMYASFVSTNDSSKRGTSDYSTWLGWIGYQLNELTVMGDRDPFPGRFNAVRCGRTLYEYRMKFEQLTQGVSLKYGGFMGGHFTCEVTVIERHRDEHGTIKELPTDTVELHRLTRDPFKLTGYVFEGDIGWGSAPGLPEGEIVGYTYSERKRADFERASFFSITTVSADVGFEFKVGVPLVAEAKTSAKLGGTVTIFKVAFPNDVLEAFVPEKLKSVEVFKLERSEIGKDTLHEIKKMKEGKGEPFDHTKISLTDMETGRVSFKAIKTSLRNLLTSDLNLGAGIGCFTGNGSAPSHPLKRTKKVDIVSATSSVAASSSNWITFDRDKYDIDKRKVNGWDVRFLLEMYYATELGVLSGYPATEFTGYASPEGTTMHNQILSENRAIAVSETLRDAVNYADFPVRRSSCGMGESWVAAYNASHKPDESVHDPNTSDNDTAAADEYKAWLQQSASNKFEAQTVWPKWRKVVISLHGQVILEVPTIAESDIS